MSAAHGRTEVRYVRDGAEKKLAAGLGVVRSESLESGGASFGTREQDFIFTTQDLVDRGFWPPQLGDEIKVPQTAESIAGQSGVFVVSSPAGLDPWRPSDEHGIATRIHTTRISD